MKSLKEKYNKEAVPALKKKFDLKNKAAVCEIEKVIINTGFGKKVVEMTGKEKNKLFERVKEDLAQITGQSPVLTKARKSISDFNLVKGDFVGAKVTLRGQKMFDFLDRLIHVALPRSRDFRGIPRKSVDQAGNLSLGMKEHTVFPEADVKRLEDAFGFQVVIKTNTKDRKKAIELFEKLGFPLQKE